jgi:hypothetical protein
MDEGRGMMSVAKRASAAGPRFSSHAELLLLLLLLLLLGGEACLSSTVAGQGG